MKMMLNRETQPTRNSVCLKVILLQQAGLVRWAALIRWRTDMIDGMISRTCQPAGTNLWESFLTHLRDQVHWHHRFISTFLSSQMTSLSIMVDMLWVQSLSRHWRHHQHRVVSQPPPTQHYLHSYFSRRRKSDSNADKHFDVTALYRHILVTWVQRRCLGNTYLSNTPTTAGPFTIG